MIEQALRAYDTLTGAATATLVEYARDYLRLNPEDVDIDVAAAALRTTVTSEVLNEALDIGLSVGGQLGADMALCRMRIAGLSAAHIVWG